MPLAAGSRLGPYEIVAPLGSGGMGEVYRARDTRLGRDVALKTLPAAFAHDPERLARFETEARSVAALSHPNVLALFDVGSHEGSAYAVMELVEGQTLRERLHDGALSPSRATAISIQLAQGLAAAHDRGVIHRDLKPENVIVTPEGRAKILDFGLARREEPNGAERGSMVPTIGGATEPGMVLGTNGYMSPEQVRGLTADARSDLFSLGVVLYEMLSGTCPFKGESSADTMSAILREDPPELSRIAPDVPPAVERIVRRCLEKQPAARFRSAADLAFALEAIGTDSSSARRGAAAAPASAERPRFKRLTFRNGVVEGARFVPGGSGIVFGASWEGKPFEIFTAHPGSPESRSLGLPPANVLAISANGEMAISLGYAHRYWNQVSGTLARTSALGGGVRPLQKDVGQADWSPDGRALALTRYVDGACRLEYPAGNVLFETPDWLGRPAVSRDGRHVAFAYHPYFGDTGGEVRIVDAAGRQVASTGHVVNISGIAWSPSGDEAWYSGIDRQLLNGIWGIVPGGAVREVYTAPTRVHLHDVSPDGRALVSLGTSRLGMGAILDHGSREVDLSWYDGSVVSDVSADGRRVYFFEGHEAGNPNYVCYVRDIDGSSAIPIGEGTSARLSPDGAWGLGITLSPKHELMMYPVGLGEARAIPLTGIERILWAGFHPDGKRLFVVGSSAGRPMRLHLVPIEGGTPQVLWDEPLAADRIRGLAVSPDGDRIAFRRPNGEDAIYSLAANRVEPLAGLGQDERVVRFDGTGRGVYVASGEGSHRRVERLDLASGQRTSLCGLAPPDSIGVVYVGSPALSPDGSTVAYSYFRHIFDLYLVEGLA